MPFSLPILIVIAGYTWVLEPTAPRWLRPLPTILVLALAAWRAIRTGEWGLERNAFAPALRSAAVLTVPALVVICAAGAYLGTLHRRGNPWGDLAFLVVWGAGQQFALQTVLFREAQQIVARQSAIWVAAAVFGALHLPNPFLAPVTFVGALAWCWIYGRHPNLVPLALSHAVSTLAILHAFDPETTGRLRIGYSYLLLE